jgi:hypothetical protein
LKGAHRTFDASPISDAGRLTALEEKVRELERRIRLFEDAKKRTKSASFGG